MSEATLLLGYLRDVSPHRSGTIRFFPFRTANLQKLGEIRSVFGRLHHDGLNLKTFWRCNEEEMRTNKFFSGHRWSLIVTIRMSGVMIMSLVIMAMLTEIEIKIYDHESDIVWRESEKENVMAYKRMFAHFHFWVNHQPADMIT